MAELISKIEIEAEKAENLKFCNGIKLTYIKNSIERLLSYIGKGGFFEQYTCHDISHINQMLDIATWLIPEQTKQAMTKAEWLMLTLAIYFHDLGMVVTKQEYNNRNNSDFEDYKTSFLEKFLVKSEEIITDDHFIYQEFVRENHAKRVKDWINGKNDFELGDAKEVFEEVQNILSHLDRPFKMDLAMICESHHRDDIGDFKKYKTHAVYGNTSEEVVNLNYIAIILRIADLLHITNDRTPSISMKLFNITNPISILEWKKQMAVRAVCAQDKRDKDGNINRTLEKDTIEIVAYFNGAETAEAYFGLSAYLKYAQTELALCNSIVLKSQKTEGADLYKFPWKFIDDTNITTDGFETKKLQFTLAQENILQLLVGHTLYNDSSVVVRELVQNSIDAVKLQKEYDKKHKRNITIGKIYVEWDEENQILSFVDNGTGMTVSDVENYLLKVGASKYREDTFIKKFPEFCSISHFGIGILTCFMVANDIDIITNSSDEEHVNVIKLRNVNGSYLLGKTTPSCVDSRIKKHGTIIKLHIRNEIDISKLLQNLKKWIVFPEIPVYYKDAEKEERIGYDSPKDAVIEYLSEKGIKVDKENYDVFEINDGNVTIALAVKHLKYFSDWTLLNLSDFNTRDKKDELLPVGTCIEGIRVEFSTPGYKNSSILSLANIKGGKYRTNVARSAIELDSNKEVLKNIYNAYRKYLKTQMDSLREKSFSESWALSECYYLMQPILNSRYDRSEPVDQDLLFDSLAELNCLIVEDDNQRKYVSPNEISKLDEINVFDSQMLKSIEALFKEIPCNSTLKDIVNLVCEDNNLLSNTKNVICNYDSNNSLHKYALKKKEVSSIYVDSKQRSIQLTYTTKNDRWYAFPSLHRFASVYIPKGDFCIEGLENEVGIHALGNIYLTSNTKLCKYILKIIEKLKAMEKSEFLTHIFLSYVFDSQILEDVRKKEEASKIFLRSFEKLSKDVTNDLWDIIDTDEFFEIVLSPSHTLYSTHNWMRNNKNGNYNAFFD